LKTIFVDIIVVVWERLEVKHISNISPYKKIIIQLKEKIKHLLAVNSVVDG
jgi:hypothetical protein